MRHVGLVVTDTLVNEHIIRNHVVELVISGQEYTHVLASVSQEAFKFQDSCALDHYYVKNQKRRAERPLSFGDMIEWCDEDISSRIIYKFSRMLPLFETRVVERKFQVLVRGVVSPVDKFSLWSEYFPNVRIGLASCDDALPNIGILAWLNLCISDCRDFIVEFDSFEGVDYDGSVVPTAPWNRDNPKYTTLQLPSLDDDEIEGQILLPDSHSKLGVTHKEVENAEGIYTAKRLIFCNNLASFEFVIALFKRTDIPLQIGETCEFSAIWNEYEKKYIVTRYRTKKESTSLGVNGFIKASVKAVEDYPGLFISDRFGLIDDPRGALALLHLSQYNRSSVVVTLEDQPSEQVRMRFRVVDVQPDKASKLERWMEESQIAVENAKGVVLECFTVYSREHANIFFTIPDALRNGLLPGQVVKFSALYKHADKNFVVTSLLVVPNEEFTTVEKQPNGTGQLQLAYRVNATKVKLSHCFLDNPIFGLIDVGMDVQLPDGKNLRQQKLGCTVWISQCMPSEGDVRSTRSPFFVVHAGEDVPTCQNVSSTSVRSSPILSAEPHVHSSDNRISAAEVNEEDVDSAMKRIGMHGDKPCFVHSKQCTPTSCGSDCQLFSDVKLLIEKVDGFWEKLGRANPVAFTEIANRFFA